MHVQKIAFFGLKRTIIDPFFHSNLKLSFFLLFRRIVVAIVGFNDRHQKNGKNDAKKQKRKFSLHIAEKIKIKQKSLSIVIRFDSFFLQSKLTLLVKSNNYNNLFNI